MFAIVVEGKRRACFEQHAVDLGRSTLNDLVLPHPDVSRHHARLMRYDTYFLLADLRSSHGTWVGGARIHSQQVKVNERFTIGPFTLSIEANVAPDPVEQRLLAAITEGKDASSRLVYADWLEERGDTVRAEFLRLQEALVGAELDHERTERLRLLAASIELKWRHAVARPAIEGCDQRFNFLCPKEWGALAKTDEPDVRYCGGCQRNVYYAPSVAIARRHVEAGDCVAVDVIPIRSADDLERPQQIVMGGYFAPPGS